MLPRPEKHRETAWRCCALCRTDGTWRECYVAVINNPRARWIVHFRHDILSFFFFFLLFFRAGSSSCAVGCLVKEYLYDMKKSKICLQHANGRSNAVLATMLGFKLGVGLLTLIFFECSAIDLLSMKDAWMYHSFRSFTRYEYFQLRSSFLY